MKKVHLAVIATVVGWLVPSEAAMAHELRIHLHNRTSLHASFEKSMARPTERVKGYSVRKCCNLLSCR